MVLQAALALLVLNTWFCGSFGENDSVNKSGLTACRMMCRIGMICRLINGQATCVPLPRAVCLVWGDPHYISFDGSHFDFQGTCTYTIAKTCIGTSDKLSFNVEAKNENRGNLGVSFLKMIKIVVYGYSIVVSRGENGRVTVRCYYSISRSLACTSLVAFLNGSNMSCEMIAYVMLSFFQINQNIYFLPVMLENGRVNIYPSGDYGVLETDFGLQVTFDWNQLLLMSVPSTFMGQLCGLCGNDNGDQNDDLQMTDGTLASDVVSFGRSWMVPDGDSKCWHDCNGKCKSCDEGSVAKYNGDSYCGLLVKKDGPFRECHVVVNPKAFVDGCIYDVCLNGGLQSLLCQALKTYADECQAAGAHVYSWREQSRCPRFCPPNSHYESCGSACPATCSNPQAGEKCKRPCIESCQCNEGFVLGAQGCVPTKGCGCMYKGLFYPPGLKLWVDDKCQKSCICDPVTGLVTCRDTPCKPTEACQVLNGVRGCWPKSEASCIRAGGSHYMSFDGFKFDFHGTCMYLLAGLCEQEKGMEPFQVELQNEHRGSIVLAYPWLVQVTVYNHVIVMSRDNPGKIMVDGLWVNPPLTLDGNQLLVLKIGFNGIVQTSFGLKVTFDWSHWVVVTVPNTYQGALCGLCGNYNLQTSDDLKMKGGNPASTPAQFGESWKTAVIPGCVHVCTGNCLVCNEAQKREYESTSYCGPIIDPAGPFRDCHKSVDPANFFKNCVFDACHYSGLQDVLCKIFSAYASVCQQSGAPVYLWRTETFCPPPCPVNSHYADCGSSCPASCASITSAPICITLCQEGCQCNEGFLLSGDQCVPLSQCGCFYNGRYYKSGEVFFTNGLCQVLCTCNPGGAIECQEVTCGANEQCKVINGVQNCWPNGEGTCTAAGDPHYITFDGLRYDFQGTCTYILTKVIKAMDNLTPFEVQVENESYRNSQVSVTKKVTVLVNGYSVSMDQGVSWKVKLDGISTNLPLILNGGWMFVNQQGPHIILQTNFGLKVLYDTAFLVQVFIPRTYRNKVGGLCGNFNDDLGDEYTLRKGGITTDVTVFGNSWSIVQVGEKCSNGCVKDCLHCDAKTEKTYTQETSCGLIAATRGPFASCHSAIQPDTFFKNCVFDMCATNGNQDVLCRNLEAYAAVCQFAGISIKAWRKSNLCPLLCPQNSHYELCVDTCHTSCASIVVPLHCVSMCFDGCQCDPGFILDGGQCVTVDKCGCMNNGTYMKVGEMMISADCSMKCTCFTKGRIKCEPMSCSAGQTCLIQDGVQMCQPVGVIPCRIRCPIGMDCKVFNGQTMCVPLPRSVCRVWGDPHYITFDGRRFDFQGTCTYTVVKTCKPSKSVPIFNVEGKNENRGNPRVSYLKTIKIEVYGYSIVVVKNENGRVRININLSFLPITLEAGKVNLYQSGDNGVLETDFGLQVTFDWNQLLLVSIPSTFRGLVCGLCGNYNGDQNDDLQMVDGTQARDVVSFGRSWAVPDGDSKCWHDCNGECKSCEELSATKYKGDDFCGLLVKKDGPFRACHVVLDPSPFLEGCIYDVCLNEGLQALLCQALKNYADMCREAGAIVYNWRELSHCPLICPPNSHYESCGNACPATCSNPKAGETCRFLCIESCQCDEGFILGPQGCVPTKLCGCIYQGRFFPPGQRLWIDDQCRQSCICDPVTGSVTCRDTPCKPTEACQVVNGVRGCWPRSEATCTGVGDPHYVSFDGFRFDFQGTCMYLLAGLCEQQEDLDPFQVEVQNEHRGHTVVAYTRLVQITVYNHVVVMSRDNAGKIMVDGLFVNLPLSLEGARLFIFKIGFYGTIQTSFGVRVTFDWSSSVTVTVPSIYQGLMCGLCGNYNQDTKDDLTMKGGKPTSVPSEFGESWKTRDIPGCGHECTGYCPICDETLKRKYESLSYCGQITDPAGPFRACQKLVDPAGFFNDCVFDACYYNGLQDVLCEIFSAYSSMCQQSGATVDPWRSDNFCPPSCPVNSHYSPCGSSCPATCASITTATPCLTLCQEGCQCNEGFLLSGDQCVPLSQCGCFYNGHYYRVGEVFFPTDLCEKCTCKPGGIIDCLKVTCAANEECKVVNGVRRCWPKGEGTCTASGDPHYITFDGLRYDFQGTCTYTLAKLVKATDVLTPFEVQVDNESFGNGQVSVTKRVTALVNGYEVSMMYGMSWKVKLDGVLTNLPLVLDEGAVSIYQTGLHILLVSDFGLKVLYDTVYFVQVTIPGTYWNQVGGLCGNFNGQMEDEFTQRDGGIALNVAAFGASWKTVSSKRCLDACDKDCPQCDTAAQEKYSKVESCGMITISTGPFAFCHSVIQPESYFKNCLFDMCATNGDTDVLCNSLQTYVAVCQSMDITIKTWRSDAFCPIKCPENSHYGVCTDTCSSTCGSIPEVTCHSKCYEGCQCDSGQMSEEGRCIPQSSCGCVYEGRYIQVGQLFVLDDCSQECTCTSEGSVKCTPMNCGPQTYCTVQDGQRMCASPEASCTLHSSGAYTTFDGLSQMLWLDGAYKMVTFCDRSEQNLQVVADLTINGNVHSINKVIFEYTGLSIILNRDLTVLVNNQVVSLPASPTEEISISVEDGILHFKNKSGIRLEYNTLGKLTISVGVYSNKLCGLCGNLNGCILNYVKT
uniref:IgGFc-binding protein-like n=1 Tax=Erpetoichthys calabaricus TaxID=27687 RepID=A0A8C4XEY0_ERPCA